MKLLSVLSLSKDNLDKVIEAKAVPAAVAAMKQHIKNKVILASGLRAISNLAHSDAVATKMAADGPITFILSLLNDSLADPPLMAEALQPLTSLCRSESNAWSMAETVLKTLNTALMQHPQDMKFHSAAYAFVAPLTVHARAAEAVLPTNFVHCVLTSLKTFKLDPPVTATATATTAWLSVDVDVTLTVLLCCVVLCWVWSVDHPRSACFGEHCVFDAGRARTPQRAQSHRNVYRHQRSTQRARRRRQVTNQPTFRHSRHSFP
jgi:hypothetical protein